MLTRVLIIDSNESFAALLKEGLETDHEYRAVAVPDGPSALAALQSNVFDLAILDLGLETPDPATLLRAIRDIQPQLPIVLIPIDGDGVPPEIKAFDVRGVLTKPFFLPELPARIAQAVGRPAPAPAPMPVVERPASLATRKTRVLPRLHLHKEDLRVGDALRALANILNAEAVVLTEGQTLIGFAGSISAADAERLARRVLEARIASTQTLWVPPGNEQIRFGQSIGEDGEQLIYSLDVAAGTVLTIAARLDTELRILRAQARQTAQALVSLGK